MTDTGREYQLRLISASGLTALKTHHAEGVLTVEQAWMLVASMETVPAATVRNAIPDALSEVDRQWLTHASNGPLFAADGTFLISIAGKGSWGAGWTLVKWSSDSELASNLQDGGDPEFVALSVDGRFLCAATTEEYDHWIVTHHFD
ncbi:hypothetical protein [Streptomyces griseocarneus]|uniref:hypothetical protein n=1 Tax=Streptomyces griseocarneus TaxID=51201 RepID=UPI00167DB16F|nr:hypothetical protein [Streptomyces griseocarneus]MBZ6473964.1 hypothetical protein [Streptomyces griseocarneus]GHG66137.1 hypothetical protein GCM10018779_37390 [Streptomyces griseocarneus]